MDKEARIYVAGHEGLVGSTITRHLREQGFNNLILKPRDSLDLCRQESVENFFALEKPEYVFLAAARVGGIAANQQHPADFIRDNLQIQTNVIDSAYRHGVKKLLFLGSSCIYPRLASQPIHEECLMGGYLESTNEPYAVAKIAGIKMCQAYNRQYGTDFICVMPANLYGPGDNFDLENAHVLAALMHRFHLAKLNGEKEVAVWGTGKPRREFLHVDDLAAAVILLMNIYSGSEIINIGSGKDISIAEAAQLLKQVIGYSGAIVYDTAKPDGTPQKLLDINKIKALGWQPVITLEEGLRSTYKWFTEYYRRHARD